VSVVFGIQHATCMRHIVICVMSGSKIFSTLSHKRLDFLKKKILIIKCVLIFTFTSETFFILRRIERDIIKSVYFVFI